MAPAQTLYLEKKIRPSCVNCLKAEGQPGVKLMHCSRCGRESYCSRDCQVAMWPSHKVICRRSEKAVATIEERALVQPTSVCLMQDIQ
ncbi:hypothetical protein BCR35DRAFT_35014 [Leucosporidium creatinivorum]|uniref:MYND-type domain-containing protein n=1 Tax=Leucosporidium creatinivorum TaxID=106004 RepID=A0A1Y2CD98_9BASI|nr:hypothetical protein BCR35DRAFT_35014 [Leucosporidium creatinivorum]